MLSFGVTQPGQPYSVNYFRQKSMQANPLNAPVMRQANLPTVTGLRLADEASQFWNISSESGPDGGNLACAYMVNKVLERVLGHKYGADSDTVNSVRTDLLQRGARIIRNPEIPQPGDLALSFNDASLQNTGGATAHIGIFLTPSLIIANSSRNRRFNQIMSPLEFSKTYRYFEVIRPSECIADKPAFSRMA